MIKKGDNNLVLIIGKMIDGADKNPFEGHLKMFADAKKLNYPTEYRAVGRLTWF